MSTTSITSGTYFIGKTLIIGSTGTSNTDYARVVDFNNNTTGTYLGVMFSATNKQPWFTFRPLGQMYSEPIMPWISYINVYYIYVFSFISDTQIKYNIYEYNGASTIVSKGTIGTYTGASAFLQNLTQFWLGRSIWANDLYNGRYNKVALYNGDLFALTEANILSTLLTLVTSTQTNIINNSTTYTFRALGTNFLGVVVNILNYNTTTGSDVSNTAITLNGSGTTSGGYLNIIGSYLETAPISSLMSLHNFNSGNKSWKMYAHTISSISGDHLTIKPHSGRNIVLDVSANNAIFMKQGENSHNLTNLISGSGIVSGSDASFANIDISGNLNPLNVNGSSIGLATKNWNSAYINTIYGETLHTRHYSQRFGNSLLNMLGQDISNGPPLANNNNKIAISNDGRVVALSSSSHSDISKGRVYVYELSYNQVSYSWTRLGLSSEIIVGLSNDDQFGWDLALSSDGRVVAGSSILNDSSGTNCGQVRLFELSNNIWRQKGSNINGPRVASESGYSISLAGSGNRIAIGAWKDNSNGTNAGAVRVYDFSASINDWRQQGQTLLGVSGSYEGYVAALSLDGLTLATGCLNVNNANNIVNAGQVKTFTISGTTWINKGIIQGPDISYLYFGRAMKLSANGNAIVIGAPSPVTASATTSTGWSYNAWTNDASTGLDSTSSYTVAVNLGNSNAIAATVNQVAFQAHALSGTNFSIGGVANLEPSSTGNITGTGIALANTFIWGSGNTRTVTLTNLIIGATYQTTFFSMGYDNIPVRIQTFTANNGPSITLDQNMYGQNMGIIINCIFVAGITGTQTFTINPVSNVYQGTTYNDYTFHFYALANRLIGLPTLSPSDLSYRYNQGSASIYGYVGGTSWTQVGQTIQGISGDELGSFVSMSNDGSIITLGGRSSADNNFRCNVQFFKNINNYWIKLGQTINGFVNNSAIAYNHALAGDGTTLFHNLGTQSSRVYGMDKTLAINSNILTISGELITSGNINPLTGVSSSLGLSTKYWGNAYIKDISTTSIEVSGNIICSRDVSINLGSSLRRWKNVFSDDLSVNKINGQVYGGSSSINLTSISGNIIPSLTNVFRLGDVSRNWSNAYISDASVSSIDVSLNINPLNANGSSLGLNTRRWGNAYLRDVSVSSIDVSGNLNPLNANGSSLGLSTKYWGNAYLRDVSASSIDVSGNLNPLTNNGSSLGLIGRTWGNAYIRDLSVSSIDVSSNSISPFVNNSASLGAPNKSWGNAHIRDVSISSIDVSGNLNPLTSNTLTLGLPTRVWDNAYIRDLSISSIDVSSNIIIPFLNNGSSLGLISKTWGNAYLRDVSVSNIDISQNLNPLVSGTSTVTATQGTGGTVSISGGYIIHSFRTTGTSYFVPASNGSVEVLIVGGGGGGGPTLGGGGGAGGVIYIPSTNVILGASYEVVVGDGGASGTNGQFSRVFGATAAGGGTSGTHDSGDGSAGGSGGGAASNNSRLNQGGGTSGNILGTNNGIANVGFIYGCSGGNMTTARSGGPCRGAGGGGAGAKGLDTNSNITGDTGQTGMGSGGVGVVNAILGPSYYWAGGGGGSGYDSQFGGWGGLGGGGGGAGNSGGGTGGKSALVDGSNGQVGGDTNGGNGGTNTGGGGGAGAWYSGVGGKGGSGIVVIRYLQGTSGSSGSNLGSALKRWKNIFVGDLSVNTINGAAYGSGGGGAASIVYSTGGSAIVNSSIVSDMIPSITNTYSLGSTSRYWNNAYINNLRASNRVYQEISGDISWSAVNGHYVLAKDAYPGLNPSSSGAKAVQTWTVRTPNTGTGNHTVGMCWSPQRGIFVAVARTGDSSSMIQTSSDGINWTSRTNTTDNSKWEDVCWSPELGLFVAVGFTGTWRIISSFDGINWPSDRRVVINATSQMFAVCWSAELGIFLACGDRVNSIVMYSSNAINWSSLVVASSNEINSVCWSPEVKLFVGVGNNTIMTSSNGTSWNLISNVSFNWSSVCWSSTLGMFVAIAFTAIVAYSYNGLNWTTRAITSTFTNMNSICWSPQLELFVCAGYYTRIITSNDGINWISSSPVFSENIVVICWSPEVGIFVGRGWNGYLLTSSLKGRPPTSYNVFDSSFNNIDETGKWNFLNIAVSGTMTAGITPVTSDDRVKHNEVGITNGLTIIDRLNPKFYQKTFTMLDASYNGDLSGYAWTYEAGLIAQEVLQVPDISFVVSGGDYYENVMNYDVSYVVNSLSYYEQKMNSDLSFTNNYNTQKINNDLSFTISYYKEKMGSDISFDVSNNIEQILSDLSFDMSYIIQKMNNEASFYISYNEQKINYDLSFEVGYYQQQAINDLSRANAYEVTTNLVSQIYGVNYNSLLTYGLAAIKELHAKVKAQDLSLLEQQATINSLAARLQALEPNNI